MTRHEDLLWPVPEDTTRPDPEDTTCTWCDNTAEHYTPGGDPACEECKSTILKIYRERDDT